MVDKFFDCLNVTNFESGKHSRNTFKDPIRPGDFRLKVPKELKALMATGAWTFFIVARRKVSDILGQMGV